MSTGAPEAQSRAVACTKASAYCCAMVRVTIRLETSPVAMPLTPPVCLRSAVKRHEPERKQDALSAPGDSRAVVE